jgi:hypothetical protein
MRPERKAEQHDQPPFLTTRYLPHIRAKQNRAGGILYIHAARQG